MKLSELFTDPATNRLSESKIWVNVGKSVMTWWFVMTAMKGEITYEMVAAYGAIVVLHEAASRAISWRYNRNELDRYSEYRGVDNPDADIRVRVSSGGGEGYRRTGGIQGTDSRPR